MQPRRNGPSKGNGSAKRLSLVSHGKVWIPQQNVRAGAAPEWSKYNVRCLCRGSGRCFPAPSAGEASAKVTSGDGKSAHDTCACIPAWPWYASAGTLRHTEVSLRKEGRASQTDKTRPRSGALLRRPRLERRAQSRSPRRRHDGSQRCTGDTCICKEDFGLGWVGDGRTFFQRLRRGWPSHPSCAQMGASMCVGGHR